MFNLFKAKLKRKLRPAVLAYRAVRAQLRPKLVVFSERPSHRKRALLSYLLDAATMKDSDPRLKGHANWWRGRELARILDSLGYNVDVISSSDGQTIPNRQYDLVLDASTNFPRLAPFQKPDTKYCLFLTGSYYGWSAPAEARRIADFERNHGIRYTPRYGGQPKLLLDMSLALADLALLVGNEVTLATYPEWARKRMKTVRMPTSFIEHRKRYGNRSGTFLYYSSARNVCKGLDLVLDVFYRHPEWSLDVVGPVESTERDFLLAYPDLHARKNIRMHGSLQPSSERFSRILDQSDALLFPSCSEGASSSVLTCCRTGIYPILSRNSGVDLPDGCGTWIETLRAASVESAIRAFLSKDEDAVKRESDAIRTFVEEHHSRAAFTKEMTDILKTLADAPPSRRTIEDSLEWMSELPENVRRNPLFG